MNEQNKVEEIQEQKEEFATSSLVENLTNLDSKKNKNNELNQKDKYRSKLITCLILFIIPIFGPIIFLSVIKPKDKLVKAFSIVSIFALNFIFIFFLLGFYKEDFWKDNIY